MEAVVPKYSKHHMCAMCGTMEWAAGKRFAVCSGCRMKRYCGTECQKRHWPQHKAECRKIEQSPAAGMMEDYQRMKDHVGGVLLEMTAHLLHVFLPKESLRTSHLALFHFGYSPKDRGFCIKSLTRVEYLMMRSLYEDPEHVQGVDQLHKRVLGTPSSVGSILRLENVDTKEIAMVLHTFFLPHDAPPASSISEQVAVVEEALKRFREPNSLYKVGQKGVDLGKAPASPIPPSELKGMLQKPITYSFYRPETSETYGILVAATLQCFTKTPLYDSHRLYMEVEWDHDGTGGPKSETGSLLRIVNITAVPIEDLVKKVPGSADEALLSQIRGTDAKVKKDVLARHKDNIYNGILYDFVNLRPLNAGSPVQLWTTNGTPIERNAPKISLAQSKQERDAAIAKLNKLNAFPK